MKFTGQVRIPEVDHPGVPATIVVEEGRTEVFLEGETLGRWSLYDVHASRLVSSAFSLSLGGEEITFIADEPVDFAYRGVDHMAEVWARYKSMTIPRRVVAVGRSRRGTVPSRIFELKDAMLQNLESAGRGAARLAPVESFGETPAEPAPWTQRIDAYSNVPAPLDTEQEPEPVIDVPAPPLGVPVEEPFVVEEPVLVEEPAPVDDMTVEPEAKVEVPPVTPRPAPMRPGPGLIPRRVDRPAAVEDSDQIFPPRVEPPPLAGSPWDEPLSVEEPLHDDVPPAADEALSEEDDERPEVVEESATPEAVTAEQESAVEPGIAVEPAAADVHELVGELLAAEPVAEKGRELVVDLVHFEDGDDGDSLGGDSEPMPQPEDLEPDLELLFAGAPSPAAERSGLLGAVRSAFARNRSSHEHEFVEAPGGIGIVRQICAECGYISIGVSD
ncbi:MAG: hypothetical protein ACRDWS_04805 [Acidimicrobiia bacterium]